MRLPYSWLLELLPEAPAPEELEALLARLGLPVEEMVLVPRPPRGVRFAVVRDAEPIPGTELKALVLDAGREVRVVSGAENARAGVGVAWAEPGTVLPGGFRVETRTLQGRVSEGMALAPAEMGVGEYAGGLLVLPPDALPPGTELAEVWPEERVFDLEITPNRADALSVLGVARDLAAALGLEVRVPDPKPRLADLPFPIGVEVEDPDGADRYLTAYARGLRIGPSPLTAQRRLLAAGQRPINNVVDATNYALFELGNPLHAFDRAALGEGLVVRRARPGERIVTLDGVERLLSREDLVIAAKKGGDTVAVAVAGVIGGANSEVDEETTEVILEAAHFDPVSIRRTARRLGLSTEASYRFERGVDPNLPPLAALRFLELVEAWAGAEVSRNWVDLGGEKPRREVPFRPSYTNRLLGTDFPERDQLEALKRLAIRIEGDTEPYRAYPPTWRVDLAIEEDLVEEVARILGYDKIPETLPAFFPAADNLEADRPYLEEQRLRRVLTGLGFQEVINYVWTSPAHLEGVRAPAPRLLLQNPTNAEENALRTALYPGLLKNLLANRGEASVLFFELGHVFLEEEEVHLAGLLAGPYHRPGWQPGHGEGFFALKGLLEAAAARLGARVEVRPAQVAALHPGIAGEVVWEGRPVGWIGILHPAIAEALEVPAPALFELKLPLPRGRRAFVEPPRFPAAVRDLAVVVPEATPHAEVAAVIRRAAGGHLAALELFDVYRGRPLGEGEKSLAYHLIFRAPDRTLTDQEVDGFVEAVIAALTQRGWRIRG